MRSETGEADLSNASPLGGTRDQGKQAEIFATHRKGKAEVRSRTNQGVRPGRGIAVTKIGLSSRDRKGRGSRKRG